MEALAPTAEWQRKFRHTTPQQDLNTDRRAYRRLSQIDTLRKRNDITQEQHRAAEKLTMHTLGAMGVRIQHSDDVQPLNADTEYPTTYHNQKLAAAERTINNARIWSDMQAFIVEESRSLVEIGKSRTRTSHAVARAFALGRLTAGLDALVDHWGFSTQRRQKVP